MQKIDKSYALFIERLFIKAERYKECDKQKDIWTIQYVLTRGRPQNCI